MAKCENFTSLNKARQSPSPEDNVRLEKAKSVLEFAASLIDFTQPNVASSSLYPQYLRALDNYERIEGEIIKKPDACEFSCDGDGRKFACDGDGRKLTSDGDGQKLVSDGDERKFGCDNDTRNFMRDGRVSAQDSVSEAASISSLRQWRNKSPSATPPVQNIPFLVNHATVTTTTTTTTMTRLIVNNVDYLLVSTWDGQPLAEEDVKMYFGRFGKILWCHQHSADKSIVMFSFLDPTKYADALEFNHNIGQRRVKVTPMKDGQGQVELGTSPLSESHAEQH